MDGRRTEKEGSEESSTRIGSNLSNVKEGEGNGEKRVGCELQHWGYQEVNYRGWTKRRKEQDIEEHESAFAVCEEELKRRKEEVQKLESEALEKE